MTSQKDIFKSSEGDAWYARNAEGLKSKDYSRDRLALEVARISVTGTGPMRILEIGCGDGSRLKYLSGRFGHHCVGVDPSQNAVAQATASGIDARHATADELPFGSAVFDVLLFGFCLYLCDDADLFRIAAEADRVLRSPGWLLIQDFESAEPVYKDYHHRAGIRSRKMSYQRLFTWHPAYSLATQEVFHHAHGSWTDDKDEWVSVVRLRKMARNG